MKEKILIVEDDWAIRENTVELLELADYCVESANNGQEGLEIALKQTPDLILCDIRMPVMDGYHLLEHVKKNHCFVNTRFIFFTASAEKKDIEMGFLKGADDYIVKPFHGEVLLEKIRFCLAKGYNAV